MTPSTTTEIHEPTFNKNIGGYSLLWDDIHVRINCDRVTDEGIGELSVFYDNNTGKRQLLPYTNVNLLSNVTLGQIAKRLDQNMKLDWSTILSYVNRLVIDDLRQGSCIENINAEPHSMTVEYLLSPILPLNKPTTIYSAGGKGKSILADYFAILIQFGIPSQNGLYFVPNYKANVLYLDWETDADTHRRYVTAIKRGMGLLDTKEIAYMKLERPLFQVIDTVRTQAQKLQVGLVIIDSQMAATASGTRGLTEAQVASEYYNLLRSLNCTTLTIDHITKVGMQSEDGTEAPFGSVVKYNRSRSQFELRLPEEDDDADHKEYALIHRKFNLGRKQKPIGISVQFVNTDDDELLSVTFNGSNVKDNPELSKTLPQWEQIRNLLLREPKLTPAEVATKLGNNKIDTKRASDILNRKKTTFSQVDGKWSVFTL